MMYVTPGMVITLIERMLGGGEEVVKVKDGYRYSDVEIALYKRVLSYLIQALKDGFSNYINMDFKAQRMEDNPSMIQDVGLDETVVIVHLNVDVTGLAVERIKICLPGTLLENIFQVIDSRKHLARGYAFEDNKETILDNIRQSQLSITGQLGTVFLDLSDIYHLKVGDVIVFRHEGRLLVKRIKAVGGDMVIHKGKKMVVPGGCFYVVGDNREVSSDSRIWEEPFVSLKNVIAFI